MYIYAYIYVYVCSIIHLFIHYLHSLFFFLLFHSFYCCFVFNFGLFKLNKIRSEECSIECLSDNIVLSLNG